MSVEWIELPRPPGLSQSDRLKYRGVVEDLASKRTARTKLKAAIAHGTVRDGIKDPTLRAALSVLLDLSSQGWDVRYFYGGDVSVRPPRGLVDPLVEKERVRYQELIKRDEQLSKPSVRQFIRRMESPSEYHGQFVSVLNLMRDGREFAQSLEEIQALASDDPSVLRSVIDPYVQVVAPKERCSETGLALMDVWRYFRHTWSSQYTTTPGRTMAVLVRDRAAPWHPVIGIGALSSAIVQLSERDSWIGWQPQSFTDGMRAHPTLRDARWLVGRMKDCLAELYVGDLIADGLYSPAMWRKPTLQGIERLEKEAEARRRDHYRFASTRDLKKSPESAEEWTERAESDLFRSKRCAALAELLQARLTLDEYLWPTPTKKGLELALSDTRARHMIGRVVRKAKGDTVGTEIADLNVCGALPPYSDVLGGKLVAMLVVGPTVVNAYHAKYRRKASEIASSMAGRPIYRQSRLAFIGTTSLYGSGSSQYNRLRMPASVLGGPAGEEVRFHRLGISRSFGTSHFSSASVSALVALSETSHMGQRVNSIFGEGVNPKLRKVRDGIDVLGWPSESLLQHGRHRIVYGVPLLRNLLDYLMGKDARPKYLLNATRSDDVKQIADWWFERWVSKRIQSSDVLERVAQNSSIKPSTHGARVTMPEIALEE
jgi:hypothetical protein